jgi:starch synthase
MPSRGWEAFPLVVLEAAAAGKAVIASRVAGLEDLVADGETGRLVEPEDEAGLARALDEVRLQGERWGETARARVGRYAWDRVAAEHEAFYRTVAR